MSRLARGRDLQAQRYLTGLALARAAAGSAAVAAFENRNFLEPAAIPDNLVAPSSELVAATLMQVKASGTFLASFQLVLTAAAPDTADLFVQVATGVTSLTGGAAVGQGFRIFHTSPLVVTGGALVPGVPANDTQSVSAGNLTRTFHVDCLIPGLTPANGNIAFEFLVTSAGGVNWNTGPCNGYVVELP